MNKALISQDDCAPDSLAAFSNALEGLTGYNLHGFKSASTFVDLGDCFEWRCECFLMRFCADDPFYVVFEIKQKAHNKVGF